MKKIVTALVLLLIPLLGGQLSAQPLLNENFSYGVNNNPDIVAASSNVWLRHSGAQGPKYDSLSLSYAGYPSSGVDGRISFTNGGSGVNDGDVNTAMSSNITTASDVYVSFLVNLVSAKSTRDYFFHLGQATLGTIFRGRVFARSNSSGWSLSLSKSSEAATDDGTVLNFEQTYLIVLKYSFNEAAIDDDQVTLYAYSSGVPSSEPGTPDVTIGPLGTGTTNDPSDIGRVAIRQGTNTPTGYVDGIRVATSWDYAPLPVELTSFSAIARGSRVELKWATATETNNRGWDVEKKVDGKWASLGFVEGAGTSHSAKSYSYVDNAGGTAAYRLKQIDRDGKFSYSNEVEATVAGAAVSFGLGQNYPNPFNPSTNFGFSISDFGFASLKVYNLLGQEVATVVNRQMAPGTHSIAWDAAGLPGGMYFYTLKAGSASETRKMLLMK